MIRAFLAIELPEALRAGLAQVQEELKRSRADVRWVAPGNIHLTLKFFGNVPDDEIDGAGPRRPGRRRPRRAPLQLQGHRRRGLSRPPHAPRVVWLGLGGDLLPLTQLFSPAGKGLRGPGLSAGRPGLQPAPHPGPGEIPGQPGATGPGRWQKLPPVDWPPFAVKELILFQSVLSPKGSTYTPLQVIPLGLNA